MQLELAFRGQFIIRYWIHINYMVLLRVKFPVSHAFLLISSKLMLFQSFWPPDIKMPYNLEEAEKRSVYSQCWQYFNVSNFRNWFSSIKFAWRFTSISKYWRSNTTKVLCLSLQKQLVLWKSKLCFDWE